MAAFAPDLSGWTQEDFAARWKKILPGLISEIEQNGKVVTVSEVFRVVYVSIVPVVPVAEVDELIFSRVCEKTTQHFCTSYESLVQSAELLSKENGVLNSKAETLNVILQGLTDIVFSISSCVEYLLSMRENISLASVRSLPRCVLGVLFQSFDHCKQSNRLYGGLFSCISDHLSSLFKAARLLLMNFSNFLEKLDVTYPAGQDKEDLCYIIQQLSGICDTVSHFDVKIMVSLWKTISRLSCQYRDILLTQLDVGDLLVLLCENMSSSLSFFSKNNRTIPEVEETSCGKMVKIIGFQMRVLVTIANEYSGYLSNSAGAVYRLILQMKSLLPPSLIALKLTKNLRDDLMRHIGVGLEPLIRSFMDDKEFVATVTGIQQETSGVARLMALLTIAQILPCNPDDVQDLWLKRAGYPEDKPRESLINSIFSCISHCYSELCMPVKLPGIVKNGMPQGEVSLYEHVVTRLCAFVMIFPERHFHTLEQCLLENVLSRRQLSALVAIDVWCFLARCGSAELCHYHCKYLVLLFEESCWTPSPECCHLVLLIRRLFRLMATEHQAELLSSAVSFDVLSILPLPAVVSSQTTSCDVIHRVCDHFSNAVARWTEPGARTVGDGRSMLLALTCMNNAFQSSVVIDDMLSTDEQRNLANQCLALLSVIPSIDRTNSNLALLQSMVSSALVFLSYLVPKLDNRSTLQLMFCCDAVINSPCCEDVVKLSVLEVLAAFSTRTFEPNTEQGQLLRMLSKLFSRLLGEENVIVHQVVLEVFEDFARKTRYESVVPDSLNGNEQVREMFVSYINQRASSSSQQMIADQETVQHQEEVVDNWCVTSSEELWIRESKHEMDISDDKIELPAAKRLKISEETAINEEVTVAQELTTLQETIENMESSISTLEAMTQKQSLPVWAASRLRELHRRLSEFI